MNSMTYEGVTHTCDNPDCHVFAFITTLKLAEVER